MTSSVDTSFIIAAVPLPAEDIKVLASRALLVARATQDSLAELMPIFDQENWGKGAALLGVMTNNSDMSPEEFVLQVLDSFGVLGIEHVPENVEGFVWAKSRPQLADIELSISKVEIYGAHNSPQIAERLEPMGYTRVEDTEIGCVASPPSA